MKKYLLPIALVLTIAVVAKSQEIKSTCAIQKGIKSTYAVQNVKTGKNLRPYNAGIDNGNKIVLYNHHEWKCMT